MVWSRVRARAAVRAASSDTSRALRLIPSRHQHVLPGVSPAIALVLLVLVAVAAAALLYMYAMGLAGREEGPPAEPPSFRIEAVSPVEAGGVTVGFRVYLRNTGATMLDPRKAAAYIGVGGNYSRAATIAAAKPLPPGGLTVLSVYPTTLLPPGTYTLKVSVEGVEALYPLVLGLPSGKAVSVVVSPENNEDNPVIREDNYATYMAWMESSGQLYTVYFRVYAKPNVTIESVYAELFNSTGQHPEWVGGNPWTWTTPYTYPDYAGAYWTPVKPGETPVTIVFSVKPSRS